MTRNLELADIQGNIIRAYGKFRYPVARYFFLNIGNAAAGRQFVEAIRPHVTTATRWQHKQAGEPGGPPWVTLNIGFTFYGLLALNLPTRTLQAMPDEFITGMQQRAHILGDCDPSRPLSEQPDWNRNWDKIWRENKPLEQTTDPTTAVHIWISMNARVEEGTDQPVPELEKRTQWLRDLCASLENQVRILATNGKNGDQEYQAASAKFATLNGKKVPLPKEHFGFTDGIGDPVFEGQLPQKIEEGQLPQPVERERVVGRGKWMGEGRGERGWEPLATGEFLLGHPDESQEDPPTARPDEFMRNGSFMVYRKLHQNVSSFRDYFKREAKTFAKVMNVKPGEAEVILQAKVVGRWPDGVPLAKAGTYEEWRKVVAEKGLEDGQKLLAYLASPDIIDFKYGDDMLGYKCPNTSHLRRVNTRDYLDPLNAPDGDNPNAKTQLNKRRRILRRGLPYGDPTLGAGTDDTEQGVAFMAICASLFRQFEFVQQQWIQYGLDFNSGNDTCPLLGNHTVHNRFAIPSDPSSGKPPYVCNGLPQFVETRGGDYFFLPSLTALRSIAMGIVDPT